MAEFLTTRATSYQLEQIILNAREKLVLVSPFVQISDDLIRRLTEADKRGVKTTLIYGKEELKPDERKKLDDLRNLSLYYLQDLHAKCYYNEDQMIITSMNLYGFSERTNCEMGVLAQRNTDGHIYEKADDEVRSILGSPHVQLRRGSKTTLNSLGRILVDAANALADDVVGPPTSKKGFCIRCGAKIGLNPDHPYCPECYGKWAAYNNPQYKEKYCHECGKADNASKARPLCKACYGKH